ncbi:hypothetical protein [Bacillus atrophaeus]|uniref:hypothetical protein n=1 Tax=Bacillus atrophaeus TaxID=1452 RepID=UPI00216247DD|nr:hypothetical protein [Bacillus atrophaeus]
MNHAVRADRLEFVLENMNFEWSIVQLRQVIDYWFEGKSIYDMSDLLKREIDELVILIVDMAKRRILLERPRGLRACGNIAITDKEMALKKSRVRHLFEDSPVYIPFIESNLLWYERDLIQFRKLWSEGQSIVEIAEYFGRNIEEIMFPILDQCRKELIEPREGGLLGKEATADDLIRQSFPV